MPTLRLMIMQAEFETADQATSLIGGLMKQFGSEPNQAALPEPPLRLAAAAAAPALATGEDTPPPPPAEMEAVAAATDDLASSARGGRRKAASPVRENDQPDKPVTVTGTIRQVLGSATRPMTSYVIFRAVSDLLAKADPPKRTTPETVASLLYQMNAKGAVERVGDEYRLKGGE